MFYTRNNRKPQARTTYNSGLVFTSNGHKYLRPAFNEEAVPHQGRNEEGDLGGHIPFARVGYVHDIRRFKISPLRHQDNANALAAGPRR